MFNLPQLITIPVKLFMLLSIKINIEIKKYCKIALITKKTPTYKCKFYH